MNRNIAVSDMAIISLFNAVKKGLVAEASKIIQVIQVPLHLTQTVLENESDSLQITVQGRNAGGESISKVFKLQCLPEQSLFFLYLSVKKEGEGNYTKPIPIEPTSKSIALRTLAVTYGDRLPLYVDR